MFGTILNFLYDKYNKKKLKKYNAIFDKSLNTFGLLRLRVSDEAKIKIGKNVVINSSWRANPTKGDKSLFYIKKNASLVIGDNVGISNSTICCSEKIVIEDDVMIGANNLIMDTDHHSINYNERIYGNTNIKTKPIIIKRGAFIGASCIILKGVKIGEKSVVGAGSVVTHCIPDGEIWAGNPAKFIKKIEK